MTNLIENEKWEEGIYQLETSDPVVGGPDGIDNLQAKQLANRTKYLKARVEVGQSDFALHVGAVNPHPQYAMHVELNEKAALASPALTGTPIAPTPEKFDDSAKLATMAALVRDRFGFSGFTYYNANAILPAAALGSVINCTAGSGPYTLTLPALIPAMSGSAIKFVSYSKNPVIVASGSNVKIWLGFNGAGSGSSFSLQNGDTATLTTDGVAWYVIDGSVLHPYAARSAFMVSTTYVQSIASAVSTKVKLDGKEFDVLGEFDVTTSRFRASTPGKYLLSGTVDVAAGVVGAGVLCFLYKNSEQYKTGATTRFAATTHTGASVTAVVDMNGSTDYVELFAYQDTNATQLIAAGTSTTYFSGVRVG
jgi:hypothetical protein